MDDTAIDPRRMLPISIEWTHDNLIGHIEIHGEYWCAVEWSEKRQAWCIEDAEGACLQHATSIHGQAASKDEAAALAFDMIRDGRMPSPQQALEARQERRRRRQQQPAVKRKADEKAREAERISELSGAAWKAKWNDDRDVPLYETLADVFDFTDAELWKSNSFASLRPRLVVHVGAVVAQLEYDLAMAIRRANTQPFQMYASKERRRRSADLRRRNGEAETSRSTAKLDRAREILDLLRVP